MNINSKQSRFESYGLYKFENMTQEQQESESKKQQEFKQYKYEQYQRKRDSCLGFKEMATDKEIQEMCNECEDI